MTDLSFADHRESETAMRHHQPAEMVTVHTPPCPFCFQAHAVAVRLADLDIWRRGAHVQDAFPYLTADEREMLISGTDAECWERFMRLDEDD